MSQNTTNPFKLRYNAEQNGGIIYVSNTILSCSNCDAANESPPGGKGNNNDYVTNFIDIDHSDETFDIVADEGHKDLYGGWSIIIVYKQDQLPLKNLSVFDCAIRSNTKLFII